MEQIRLDLIPNGVMPNVHASQFDNGRTIRFNLYEGESPFSLLATDYVKVACNNNISVSTANVGNSHDWTIPDSVVADSGVFIGELTIERDSVIVGSKNFVLNVEEDAYNGKNIEERTASGNIANFETNLQDNLTACKCEINPEQDLHGYTKPWSGGAGKNKLNYDAWKTSSIVNGTAVWENNGVKLTATSNDCYTSAPNSFPVSARIPVTEGETITLSWEENTNRDGSIYIFPNNTTTGMVRVYNQQVKKLSYTATSGVTYVTFRFGVSNSGDTIAYKNIQIEKGSTATAYEPYENICPISGFPALNVTRTGKNLFDKSLLIDQVAWNVITLQLAPNALYTIGSNLPQSATNELPCYVFTSSGNPSSSNLVYSGHSILLTTLSDGIVKIQQRRVSGTDSFQNYNWQIENGLTAIDFEPYNGQTATVNFGQTVYGGVLDVTNGKLTITHKGLSIDNNSALYNSGNSAYLNITDAKIVNEYASAISNKYEYSTWSGATNDNNNYFTLYQNTAWSNARLAFNRNGLSLADFITSLTNNPIQVVYELATPTEITLTPKQIEAIVGINNVFHDCNGETEVGYLIEV